MEWQGGRYESQRQWCTVSYPAVSSARVSLGFRYWGGVVGWCGVCCWCEDMRNWPGAARGGSGPVVWCVLGGVLLSRTLAGAVPSALSGLASGFGMDTGRFPVAVTTETTTWTVRVTVISGAVIRLLGRLATHTVRVLVVGLGVDRIVDARVYRVTHPRRYSHAH